MATGSIEHDETVFEIMASEITKTFTRIIEQATKRRDELLTELNALKTQIQEKMKLHKTELNELKRMRARLMGTSVKQNTVLNIQEAALAPIDQQIKDLEEKISDPLFRFECPIDDVLDKIEGLGAFIDEKMNLEVKYSSTQRIDYSNISFKKQIGKHGIGNGEFQSPLRMDANQSGLFVVDRKNKRVQVYDVESEKPLQSFGKSHFSQPSSITVSNKYCYVTDFAQNKVYQFNIENYSLVKAVKETGGSYKSLKRPAGLTRNTEELIYVTDGENNRVCVFASTLKYLSELGVGMLVYPRDIKILNEEIFVLDEGSHCLHTFTMSGEKIRSLITCGPSKQVRNAASFCLDADRNILITDIASKTFKVFSPGGELLHRIGEEAPDVMSIGECAGVLLVGNKLFLTCQAPLDCIMLFC